MRNSLLLLILVVAAGQCRAEEENLDFLFPQSSGPAFHVWADASYESEYFDRKLNVEVNTWRYRLTPTLDIGDWHFELELPWSTRDISINDQITVSRTFLLRTYSRTYDVSTSSSDSAMEDGYFRVRRQWLLSPRWTSFMTLEYKHDNGDADEGFGTDSRDVSLRPSLTYARGRWFASAEAGYIWADPGDYQQFDRAVGSGQLGMDLVAGLSTSVNYNYQDRSNDMTDVSREWSLLVQWQAAKRLVFSAAAYDSDSDQAPDRDWSLAVSLML